MKQEPSTGVLDTPLLAALLVVLATLAWQPAKAHHEVDERHAYVRLNLMPWSHHNNIQDTDVTNEKHNGIGLSLTMPTDPDQLLSMTYGLMHYTNSYGDNGLLVSVATETTRSWAGIHYGVGIGLAPAYEESDHEPVIGWVSFRYGWVTVLTAPSVVTAVMFSIPLN